MTSEGEVRLGRDETRRGWAGVAVLVLLFLAAVACTLLGWVPAVFLLNFAYVFLGIAGMLVFLLTRRGRDAVVLTEHHLSVEGRVGPHQWKWDEVLEAGASSTAGVIRYWAPGLTLLIRPEGRAWASPGPNAPLAVALPVFGKKAQSRAVDLLRSACHQHGVPFNENGLRMAEQPRPSSLLRTDQKADRTAERTAKEPIDG